MALPSWSLAAIAVFSVFVTAPAWAHHSHGNYDLSKWATFEATVKQLHLVNPHSFLYVEVKDDKGQARTWSLETVGVIALRNKGITRETVRQGDAVKVRCHVLKDGGNGCLLGFVTPMHGDQTRGHGVEVQW
jgi:hypothetical protein